MRPKFARYWIITDSQDEEERAVEIEEAWEAEGMTLMSVPTHLVPEIRAILAREETA